VYVYEWMCVCVCMSVCDCVNADTHRLVVICMLSPYTHYIHSHDLILTCSVDHTARLLQLQRTDGDADTSA
jgi:hypothetical protein